MNTFDAPLYKTIVNKFKTGTELEIKSIANLIESIYSYPISCLEISVKDDNNVIDKKAIKYAFSRLLTQHCVLPTPFIDTCIYFNEINVTIFDINILASKTLKETNNDDYINNIVNGIYERVGTLHCDNDKEIRQVALNMHFTTMDLKNRMLNDTHNISYNITTNKFYYVKESNNVVVRKDNTINSAISELKAQYEVDNIKSIAENNLKYIFGKNIAI